MLIRLAIVSVIIPMITGAASTSSSSAFVLEHRGDNVLVPETDFQSLSTFCTVGSQSSFLKFWSSSTLKLKLNSDDFSTYLGPNASEVARLHEEASSGLFFSGGSSMGLPWKTRDFRLDPFKSTCLGVLTAESYTVTLKIITVNFWMVLMTLIGVFGFFSAPKLCRNVFFHYTTGISVGILFSLLVITYFVQKRIRASFFSWILGFYSLALYFLTSIWYNLQNYIVEHQFYFLGYLGLSGLISFAVCYRLGPVENPRSLNLIQWSMQGVSLLLIYLSSYHQTASLSIALIVMTWSLIPATWKTKVSVVYHKKFVKPKVKLLTEEEYMDQSRIATEKALEDLRNYCKSPQCKAWTTVSRLQSPSRFAEFIEGASHVTADEIINYSQTSFDDYEVTDDEDNGGSNRRQQVLTDDEEEDMMDFDDNE